MSSKFGNLTPVPKTFTAPSDTESLRFYSVINQVDLVPTLCYLFGIPIPKINLGKILLDVINEGNGECAILASLLF